MLLRKNWLLLSLPLVPAGHSDLPYGCPEAGWWCGLSYHSLLWLWKRQDKEVPHQSWCLHPDRLAAGPLQGVCHVLLLFVFGLCLQLIKMMARWVVFILNSSRGQSQAVKTAEPLVSEWSFCNSKLKQRINNAHKYLMTTPAFSPGQRKVLSHIWSLHDTFISWGPDWNRALLHHGVLCLCSLHDQRWNSKAELFNPECK